MENLLNKLFPPKCLFCGKVSSLFCTACQEKCVWLNKTFVLSEKSFDFKLKARCLYVYEGLVRDCIKKSKFHAKQFAALKTLSFVGARIFADKTCVAIAKDRVLIPIPSSKKREELRGFNHVDVIAEAFGKVLNVQINKKLLVKTKNTGFQYEYTRYERFQNVKDAFRVVVGVTVPEKVLLVDDICTTGATFLESANVLYSAGAKDIVCLALSRKL